LVALRYYTPRMSTVQTLEIESTSSDDTLQLGEQVGRRLRGGEVIEMLSDLGGGKTTFVRGLAQGLEVDDVVHSPSFTVSNEYQGRELRLYHFDFYRLIDPGILRDELAEAMRDEKGVVVIEWADIVEDVLPADRLRIAIKSLGENLRQINLSTPKKLSRLFNT
jgi:tRNA threonylcarbamoyladenosine biosynthesis protein TsaE